MNPTGKLSQQVVSNPPDTNYLNPFPAVIEEAFMAAFWILLQLI